MASDIFAYDSLPPAVRSAIASCRYPWHVTTIAAMLRTGSEAVVVRFIVDHDDAFAAEHAVAEHFDDEAAVQA